jgi:hypothetical protein
MLISPTLVVVLLLVTCGQPQHKSATDERKTETVDITADGPLLIGVDVLHAEIRAGDVFAFTANLDKSANLPGGVLQFEATGPGHIKAVRNCAPTSVPEQYACDFPIPAIGPAGNWKIRSIYLFFEVGNQKKGLKNWTPIDFRVLANPNVVLPTSAVLSISVPQADLLRRQLARLEERIQILKAAMSKYESASQKGEVTPLLKQNLAEAMTALAATRVEFLELAPGSTQKEAAEIFFGDLRASYEEAIAALAKAARNPESSHTFQLVANKAATPSANPLFAAALRPLEQNELAYSVVTTTGSLTFDLEVDSNPAGASVSYHRRGDSWQSNQNPTNSTIHSLPYAIWIVKFEKMGYKAEEREHDPFRESNHVLKVELER